MEKLKLWLNNTVVLLKNWILGHFTKVELVSVLDTFGAEVTGVLFISYQSFVNGQFTIWTALALVGAAVWRSAFKALRKLASIYIARYTGNQV